LVLIKNAGRAGSDKFIDAIYNTASKMGFLPGDIKVRVCNGDIEETVARITDIFLEEDRPNGIIVDGEYLLNLAEKVCVKMNLRVPQDVDIVFEGGAIYNVRPEKFAHTHVKTDIKIFINESISKLKEVISGQRKQPQHISLPVELIGPKDI
jgi:DNA-binding LacI/PurR family transcriptional regulator